MKVKFKKLNDKAITPTYAKSGDAAMDIYAIDRNWYPTYIEYSTGLAFEIPEGYVMLIFPRSSVSNKSMILANSVGVVDSGYRGEIKFRFKNLPTDEDLGEETYYEIGDRIGQVMIIPYPTIELEEVEELSSSVRGENGFGSTGK